MALTFSTEMLAAIEAREVAAAILFELKLAGGSLYAWNQHGSLVESVIRGTSTTWEGLGERISLPQPITISSDLQGSTVTVQIEAGAILDNADFAGRLVDGAWHQREIVIRHVLFAPTSNYATVLGAINTWTGLMDRGEQVEGVDGAAFRLSCESGTYQFFRTNQFRRTDENQKYLADGDRFFDLTAKQVLQTVPFGRGNAHLVGRA